MIKINWDATVDKKKGQVGLGIVARDGNGKFVATRCMTFEMVLEPIMVEALVALHPLIMGKDLGLNTIIFEGDTFQVINVVNSQPGCKNSCGHFVEDIQAGLQMMGMAKSKHVF